MNSTLKSTIKSTDKEAQYDEKAKKILAQKEILAHILVKTVDEFKEMNPKDVVKYIEGEPLVGVVPIEGGLTNVIVENNGQQIVGLNTENSEINEGLIRFDIIFYVRLKDGLSKIIINVEAQKEEPFKYDILNRAIFYASRLISSQKERDFENINYNDIKKVFSIWICMNMDKNTLTHILMTKEDILDSSKWKGNLDLMNIVMIGLSKNIPEYDNNYELHRLLTVLFSKQLEVDEKLEIIENEYNILLEDSVREEVNVMCNLGEGIREEAYKEAYEEAYEEAKELTQKEADIKYIMNMYANDISLEQISAISKLPIEEVEKIIDDNK